MLYRTLKSYDKFGYKIDVGKPSRLYSILIDKKNKRSIDASGGITITDAFVFLAMERLIKPYNIFIIGNAFGLSTFFLAELFPNANIDVIEAEIEGFEVKTGSKLTNLINKEFFGNVNLTIGYSPKDIEKAVNANKYNLVFFDGYHTNEQLLLDFNGMLPYLDENCVLYFHDIAFAKMFEAWEIIKSEGINRGFIPFNLGFTQMGCTALVRGYLELIDYMSLISNDFDGPYFIGFSGDDLNQPLSRPFFWDYSFHYLEKLIRIKIKKMLTKFFSKIYNKCQK